MENIKVRQHVGQDGILHLDLSVGVTELDLEVADIYGICSDDPITLDKQGISEAFDDELIGAFDLQITEIALANNLILVTHNTREFDRVDGLQIKDWEVDA